MGGYWLLRLALLCVVGVAQTLISQAQNTPADFLQPHNFARREVGVEPLKWNLALEAYAKGYAQKRSGDCELIHSGGPYGENIYWGFGQGFSDAKVATKYWVDEKQFYDYGSNSCESGKECLHYTQMVWRNTKHLGCAAAACSSGKVFFVCSYDPPGNIIGERPY